MKHSQEEMILDSERLDAIGAELAKVEKEIREGLGLRACRKKGEGWKVANTIDFITVVLEHWGCGTVENNVKKCRKNGKVIREYSIQMNKKAGLWNKIKVYDRDSIVNNIIDT